MHRKIVLFIFILITVGCAQLNPKPPIESDLVGQWITVGMTPYGKFQYIGNDYGLLAFTYFDETDIYEVKKFTVREFEFTIEIYSEDEEEPELLIGSIFEDQLSLKSSDDEIEMWFVKEKYINELKIKTDSAIDAYLESKRNKSIQPNADASVD